MVSCLLSLVRVLGLLLLHTPAVEPVCLPATNPGGLAELTTLVRCSHLA